MSNDRVYFKNLDAIRFIAALMVFMQHGIAPSFTKLNITDGIIQKLIVTVCNGGTGVSIFFVLSGFLITYLIITEHEKTGKFHLKNFYIRRILRIWPLYYAVIFFSFLLYPCLKSLIGMNTPLASNFIYHLFFLSNIDLINVTQFFNGSDAMSQNITWSVSIEEQFYVIWPLIFLLPRKFWGLLMLSFLIYSLVFRLNNTSNHVVLYFHTFSVFMDLAIGGLFALGVKSHKSIRQFFENTNTYTHLTLIILAFSTLYFGTEFILGQYSVPLGRIIPSTLFAFIITSQALTINKSILNLSNLKFASKWGVVTYGIYLLHPIAILILDVSCRLLKIKYDENFYSHFSIGILAFILTLFISKISYNYYELKFLKLKNKFQFIRNIKLQEN